MAATDVPGNEEHSKVIPASSRQDRSFCGDSKPAHVGGHGGVTFSNRFMT